MDVNSQPLNGDTHPNKQFLNEVERLQCVLKEQDKLASIGLITAGILHEIRNPLNFIFNFSKVNAGLLDEFREVLAKGVNNLTHDDFDELKDIEVNLNRNLNKITENGQRAMRIIVNMLAQSRRENAEDFESTDINQLVDEFVKLAYHGIRGNNSVFNLSIITDFDASIGKVNINAHHLGRGLLNIVSNACYAMEQKSKQVQDGTYTPQLTVATKKTTEGFRISIMDNGTGIPDEIKENIFKPFFTTKTSSDGTGLGLSMTHDIIQKLHKGKLEVNSKAGEYTEFVIDIPVKY
ncbi:sensor histidine kinase [Mucilaginibacter aquatilis]|uniref:histidine kinase n=1 Tax=Mucilaginibacter aquatilis TaxID=1517760 RepID=A0A6I4I7S7_9SPHI|nr:HAMP domain-containing sensor histidine kinase [Mucilaginibacter aquatilis]MVN91240.1 two-component sensor histidine kinase [Mucilaginibacter aquatilis]